MGTLANSTNSPRSAGWQLLLLSPEPAPGTSGKQNQRGTEASSISPRTITEHTGEDGRLSRQIHCRLAKDKNILPNFLTFPTGGKKKEKSQLRRFSKPSAKQGLQHTDQGKDTRAEIMDAHYLSLGEENAHMPQPP